MRSNRVSIPIRSNRIRVIARAFLVASLVSFVYPAQSLAGDRAVASAMEKAVLQVLTPAQAEAYSRGAHPATIVLSTGESLEAFMARLRMTIDALQEPEITEKVQASFTNSINIQYSGDINKVNIVGRTSAYSFLSSWDWGTSSFADVAISGSRVGINTTTPARTLDVVGEIGALEGFLVYYPTTGVYDNTPLDAPYSRVSADSFHTNGLGVGQIFIEGRAIDSNTIIYVGAGVAGGQSAQDVRLGDSNEVFVDTSTNRVGIGLSNPDETLEVSGNIKLSGSIVSDGDICIGSGC